MRQIIYLVGLISVIVVACQKTGTTPASAGPAAITIVNAIPTTNFIIPILNTFSPVPDYFYNAEQIYYGNFLEYSPPGGHDTIYVVHDNDTVDISLKSATLTYSGILNLNTGSIYSLFLTGADTTSPDYLFTIDSLPYHTSVDSTVGIRFVNLSTGSNPISINLEGSPNGSEVGNLAYKGITAFKDYTCNSTTTNSGYLFVVRDMVTGDSLISFGINGVGSGNGIGLIDPNNGKPLIFKNVTIAVYGSENPASSYSLSMMLIDDY
jgi:hypothetical protein